MSSSQARHISTVRRPGSSPFAWQLLIVVIWLSVPVIAYQMLRADHERYLLEFDRQFEACEDRRLHVLKFTELYQLRASGIRAIDGSSESLVWQREWSSTTNDAVSEAALLPDEKLNYYPSSEARLIELEDKLELQRHTIEEAARLREAYLKSVDGLTRIAERIDEAQMMADYYRRLGAESIYYLIMEDVAILESRYRDYRQNRQSMLNDSQEAMAESEQLNREIVLGLSEIQTLMASDADRSYNELLVERFRGFNLREELDRLIAGEPARAGSAPGSTI
jgi:hypothetical protein